MSPPGLSAPLSVSQPAWRSYAKGGKNWPVLPSGELRNLNLVSLSHAMPDDVLVTGSPPLALSTKESLKTLHEMRPG